LNEKGFITTQIAKIKSEGIKTFPEDFCNLSDTKVLDLPERNLLLGKDFFGTHEITTTTGETILNVKDQSEAKFIIYSIQKKSTKVKVPRNLKLISESVEKYECYLDELLNKIKNDYRNENLKSKNIGIVSGEIFKKLNLTRL
jgi:hypothetical protein